MSTTIFPREPQGFLDLEFDELILERDELPPQVSGTILTQKPGGIATYNIRWPISGITFQPLSNDEHGKPLHSLTCSQAFQKLRQIKEEQKLVPLDIWGIDALLGMGMKLPNRLRSDRGTCILLDGEFLGSIGGVVNTKPASFKHFLFLEENDQRDKGLGKGFSVATRPETVSILTYRGIDIVAACIKIGDIITQTEQPE